MILQVSILFRLSYDIQRQLADTINAVTAAGGDAEVQVELLKETTQLLKKTERDIEDGA